MNVIYEITRVPGLYEVRVVNSRVFKSRPVPPAAAARDRTLWMAEQKLRKAVYSEIAKWTVGLPDRVIFIRRCKKCRCTCHRGT